MTLPRKHALLVGSTILTVTAVVVLVAAIIIAVRDARPWNPLGPYPTQIVTNRLPGISGPVVRSGAPLIVEGTLCSRVDTLVRTTISWQGLLDTGKPRDGALVTVAIAVPQQRAKGCVPFDRAHRNAFINPMPDQVVRSVQAGITRWRVVGFELPIRPDGRPGLAKAFETELFEVIP